MSYVHMYGNTLHRAGSSVHTYVDTFLYTTYVNYMHTIMYIPSGNIL